MNRVHVAYCGCVTPLGKTPEALWDALTANQCAIAPVRRFPTHAYVNGQASCLPELDAPGNATRLDALLDLMPLPSFHLPKDTLVITASTKAGIDQLEACMRMREARMEEVLPGVLPGRVGRRMGIEGIGWNINAACASGTIALGYAAASISTGSAECAVVCGLDLVTEFVFSGFSALKALSPSQCRPFDIHRDGLLLGEGAGLMILMNEKNILRSRAESLGIVAGWGISSDANHITAPSREGEGLIRSTRLALDSAGIVPEQVAAIVAHGTGTVFNDAMEIKAFSSIFGNRRLPMVSTKGALGHTMGACGVLEAIIAIGARRRSQLPPTCGLQTPEPEAAEHVASCIQTLDNGYIVSTNSGFGGINAALLLKKGGS